MISMNTQSLVYTINVYFSMKFISGAHTLRKLNSLSLCHTFLMPAKNFDHVNDIPMNAVIWYFHYKQYICYTTLGLV